MNYRKLGNGEPIILVHGSVISWPQISEFETGLAKSLVPILRENIGEEKENIEEFFELVSHTDPRSIVEVDYKKVVGNFLE